MRRAALAVALLGLWAVIAYSSTETRSPEYWVGYRAGQYDAERKHRDHDRELQKGIEEQALGRVKAIGEREVCRERLKDCTCP